MLFVESIKNSGSKFYFTLEFEKGFQPRPEIEHKHSNEIKNALRGINVLLVEDNKFNQVVAQAMLEKWSAKTDVSEDGQQALDKLRTKAYDLILMDIKMPGIDGYEATMQIRQFNKEVVIISQTAYGLAGDREKGLRAGCNEYLPKPIQKEDLLEMIRRFFYKDFPA